jgi:hypothetical protein
VLAELLLGQVSIFFSLHFKIAPFDNIPNDNFYLTAGHLNAFTATVFRRKCCGPTCRNYQGMFCLWVL